MILHNLIMQKFLVLGDVMLDRYWFGALNRISPEAPVPVVRVQQNEERAGGAANVAMNIASLNVPVTLLGLTGPGWGGGSVNELVTEAKNRLWFCSINYSSDYYEIAYFVSPSTIVTSWFWRRFSKCDQWILVGKIRKCGQKLRCFDSFRLWQGTLNEVQKMIQIARNANVPVLIDPKGTDFWALSWRNIINAEYVWIWSGCRQMLFWARCHW